MSATPNNPVDVNAGSSTSATDIITYIGVPLAVLGVLPILYNTVTTLVTLSKVRRLLRKSRIAGIARGDVINHVIEVELPRFTIAPLDREEHGDEYWTVYRHPSLVKGGSWTSFNWKMHAIGLKTQRIEYADQLRQPQAEIGFEELISYLLDLGAVPSAAGFRLLRTTGLWVPNGTALMLSPDLQEPVLKIAPLDDSDGNLSLAIQWPRIGTMRDISSLPPYWIRITAPPPRWTPHVKEEEEEVEAEEELLNLDPAPGKAQLEDDGIKEASSTADNPDLEAARPKSSSIKSIPPTLDKTGTDLSAATAVEPEKTQDDKLSVPSSIRCHISMDGLIDAMGEDAKFCPTLHLPIDHLEIRKNSPSTKGVWFASAATALGAASLAVLWNYHITDEILSFTRKDTFPCGILEMLGVVDDSQTPDWATTYDDEAEAQELRMKRMRDQMNATMAENRLPPDQRNAAVRARMAKSHDDWMDDLKAKRRRETQRADTRMIEALQSARWDNKLVATHNLAWLKKNTTHFDEKLEMQNCVEWLLLRMLSDRQFATDLTNMLDEWKGWVDNGGLRKTDYHALKEKQEMFAYASLLVSIIRDSHEAAEGSLAMDLQESIRIWKKVRLG